MEVKHILVLRSTSIANVVLRAFEFSPMDLRLYYNISVVYFKLQFRERILQTEVA